jgi:hypothetical protein
VVATECPLEGSVPDTLEHHEDGPRESIGHRVMPVARVQQVLRLLGAHPAGTLRLRTHTHLGRVRSSKRVMIVNFLIHESLALLGLGSGLHRPRLGSPQSHGPTFVPTVREVNEASAMDDNVS